MRPAPLFFVIGVLAWAVLGEPLWAIAGGLVALTREMLDGWVERKAAMVQREIDAAYIRALERLLGREE